MVSLINPHSGVTENTLCEYHHSNIDYLIKRVFTNDLGYTLHFY